MKSMLRLLVMGFIIAGLAGCSNDSKEPVVIKAEGKGRGGALADPKAKK